MLVRASPGLQPHSIRPAPRMLCRRPFPVVSPPGGMHRKGRLHQSARTVLVTNQISRAGRVQLSLSLLFDDRSPLLPRCGIQLTPCLSVAPCPGGTCQLPAMMVSTASARTTHETRPQVLCVCEVPRIGNECVVSDAPPLA